MKCPRYDLFSTGPKNGQRLSPGSSFSNRSRRSKAMPIEQSIERFRRYPESRLPIPVAEIPRPLWQQHPIDWDDEDVPPLPQHFDDDVIPLTSSRRRLFGPIAAALVGTLVLGTSLACLLTLPWTARNEVADAQRKRVSGASGSQTVEADLGSRIDIAMAALIEDPNASEQRRALIRSLRPDLPLLPLIEPSAPTAPGALIPKPEGALSR